MQAGEPRPMAAWRASTTAAAAAAAAATAAVAAARGRGSIRLSDTQQPRHTYRLSHAASPLTAAV